SYGNSDYWLVKLDAGGNKIWERSFGGTDFEILQSVQQTTDGGYILGGRSTSGISGNKTNANYVSADYWVVKTDANGVKVWDKAFGGSNFEDLLDIHQTSDGGYILG